MNNSGKFDVNGVEIKDGDVVRITLDIHNSKPIIKDCKVWYSTEHAAFMCDWHKGGTYLGGFCKSKVTFEVVND